MSLVRIPRLWEKRHYYHEWKTLNENRNLDEDDALELFKHQVAPGTHQIKFLKTVNAKTTNIRPYKRVYFFLIQIPFSFSNNK